MEKGSGRTYTAFGSDRNYRFQRWEESPKWLAAVSIRDHPTEWQSSSQSRETLKSPIPKQPRGRSTSQNRPTLLSWECTFALINCFVLATFLPSGCGFQRISPRKSWGESKNPHLIHTMQTAPGTRPSQGPKRVKATLSFPYTNYLGNESWQSKFYSKTE